jgi:hypothetical protein
MEILLPMGLLAGLLLMLDVLWSPPGWLRGPAGSVSRTLRGVNASPGAGNLEWDTRTLPFVRRRMDALAEELERLDRDPAVFARAFRTIVAKSAYEALMADASRLSAVHSLDLDAEFDLDLGFEGTPTQQREELEL